jgi:DNA-binding transcriptional MerR regulator
MTSGAVPIQMQQAEQLPVTADMRTAEPNFLFIGELSRETGADPKTIRFYEREGLLSPPRHGRFRTYLSDDVKRLKDILVMRRMGIGIAQIRSLLASEGGFNAEGGAATANLLLNHLETLRQKQAELTRQMEATTTLLQRCTPDE